MVRGTVNKMGMGKEAKQSNVEAWGGNFYITRNDQDSEQRHRTFQENCSCLQRSRLIALEVTSFSMVTMEKTRIHHSHRPLWYPLVQGHGS